jgi:hypothetical protein
MKDAFEVFDYMMISLRLIQMVNKARNPALTMTLVVKELANVCSQGIRLVRWSVDGEKTRKAHGVKNSCYVPQLYRAVEV